jgi:hypothetical protein
MPPDSDIIVRFAAVAGIVGSFALFALFILMEWSNRSWSSVSFNHFAATVGLPSAAAGALS